MNTEFFTALDLLEDPDLLAAIRKEHSQKLTEQK